MSLFEQYFSNGDTQDVDTTNVKIVFWPTVLRKKTTQNGIKVYIKGNTIIKEYSKNYKVFMSFSSEKDAKKEFSKYRQVHKTI